MGAITVRDITNSNVEDVFRVCSHAKLDDPLQREGIELRRSWIRDMNRDYGSCIKVAYLDEKPVALLQFYPEEAAQFLPKPRRGAVLLRCVYNPFEEARGKGASTALVKNLIEECKGHPMFLRGEECSFIASEPFNTGEGIPMKKFYTSNGFVRMGDEMVYRISSEYKPSTKPVWNPDHANKEVATIIYDPTCEYSYASAIRVSDALLSFYPTLPIWIINQWQNPGASLSLANKWLIVKGTPINVGFRDRETFDREVKQAVEKKR
jgi:hypothetical protein